MDSSRAENRKFWIPNALDRQPCPFSILLQDIEGFLFLPSVYSLFFFFLFSFLSFFSIIIIIILFFWKWRPRSGKILKDVYLLCFRCCHLGGRPSPVVYPSKSVPTNLTDWLCTVVAELIRGYVNFVRYIYFPSLKFYYPIIIFVSLKNCTGQKIRGNFINIFKNWETWR